MSWIFGINPSSSRVWVQEMTPQSLKEEDHHRLPPWPFTEASREVRPMKLPMQPYPHPSIREAISATGWPGFLLLTSETALALCDFEKSSVTLIFFNKSDPLNWLRSSHIPRGPVWLWSGQYMPGGVNSSLKQPQHLPKSEAGGSASLTVLV